MQYISYQGSPTKHAFYLVRKLCNPEWLDKPLHLSPEILSHRAKPLLYGNKKLAVWGYDKHMAYPPCFNIALGCGKPERYTGSFLNDKRKLPVGVWCFEDNSWLWTPQAQKRQGVIKDGWYWQESHYVLKPFYEYLKWWHDNSEPGSGARKLIKDTYTTFLGLLAHKPKTEQDGYIYAPDWRCMIISEARMRLEGQISKVKEVENKEPIAVKIDALYYKEQVTCLPLGQAIGNFREEKLQ